MLNSPAAKDAYRDTGKEKVKAHGTAGMRTQRVIFLAHSIGRIGRVVLADHGAAHLIETIALPRASHSRQVQPPFYVEHNR